MMYIYAGGLVLMITYNGEIFSNYVMNEYGEVYRVGLVGEGEGEKINLIEKKSVRRNGYVHWTYGYSLVNDKGKRTLVVFNKLYEENTGHKIPHRKTCEWVKNNYDEIIGSEKVIKRKVEECYNCEVRGSKYCKYAYCENYVGGKIDDYLGDAVGQSGIGRDGSVYLGDWETEGGESDGKVGGSESVGVGHVVSLGMFGFSGYDYDVDNEVVYNLDSGKPMSIVKGKMYKLIADDGVRRCISINKLRKFSG